MSQINQVIRNRKSVYPPQYIDKPIPREIIEELLENANHAPTHRLTEPWRFKVFLGEGKKRLGDFLAEKYRETVTEFVPAKFEKIKVNPTKAGAVIAIILHRDPEERIPEWEETASVACAVQNMWMSCSQYGLGGYWSSPDLADYLGELTKLKENEKCLGFFYLGYCDQNDRIVKKKPVEEKVSWVLS
ncbi:MAG: nitroreductase [Cyclobacteriaceae bacterium]